MKKIYKISAIVFLSFTMIISSCKKEETIVEGCADSSAMNYLSTATSNDGSCIFAYNIAQGDWAIDTSCDSVTISISFPISFEETISISEMFSDSVEITGEETNVVSMDINGNKVLADIASNGTVTIQDNQTIAIDVTAVPIVGPLISPIEVDITGSGKIETATNGDLTLNLAFEILGSSQSSSCEITFTK